jgi:hypothetical protein
MRAADLLSVWEQGRARSPVHRARLLAEVTGPRPAEMTVGRRDGLLMDLHGALFGTSVSAVAHCPGCGEPCEVGFDLGDVRVPPPEAAPAPVEVAHGGYRVRARPPTIDDLASIEHTAAAREALLGRCVLDAWHGAEPVTPEDLPGDVVALLGERLSEADPQADIRLALTCPACAHPWSTVFDIVAFLWHAIEARACQLVAEVHALASAYGWPESEILAMSAGRRSLYLRMVRP